MKSKRNKATTYRLQSCLVSLQNGSFFPLYAADVHQDFYMRISAYAHHPHEPHGSASACPSLVPSSKQFDWTPILALQRALIDSNIALARGCSIYEKQHHFLTTLHFLQSYLRPAAYNQVPRLHSVGRGT